MCFFKRKTTYEMGISDWSADGCSSVLVDVAAVLFHAMLDVDFFAAVAREGDIHAAERSILQPVLPLRLVEKIGTEIAFAEEQPALTRCSSNFPLLQKCA